MKKRTWMLITEVQGHRFEVEMDQVDLTFDQIKQFVEKMGCKFRLKLR